MRRIIIMNKNYQIDRRQESGELDRYDIVKGKSLNDALQGYLGEDYKDYSVSVKYVNGKKMLTAVCPEETSNYFEVTVL
jgi:hypothetical protein